MSHEGVAVPVSRLDAGSLGHRVVVRHRLPDGRATDVVGELVSLAEDALAVRPDGGPPVAVPLAAVVAAKVIPPRTVRPSSSVDDLQRVADAGWPGLERERLGGWLLRAGGGFTGRANSALPLGDPGLPVEAALTAVEAFYDARGLRPAVQVPFGLTGPDSPAPGLDAVLAGRDWTHDPPTLMMTADLRRVAAPSPEVEVSAEPDDDWLGLYRYRGGPLPDIARQVLTAAPLQGFGSVRRGGRTVAVGRVAVAAGWAGVTAMQTDDGHLRQGLGSLMLRALLAWGAERGSRFGYLQVFAANAPAVALYDSVGFAPHHRYHYRRRTLLTPPTFAREDTGSRPRNRHPREQR